MPQSSATLCTWSLPMRMQPTPQIAKYLAARKVVSVSRIEKIRPTLEDVFVSLTTTRERRGGALA